MVARKVGVPPGETVYTVARIIILNMYNAGINAASQEVFSTCEPLGVIV